MIAFRLPFAICVPSYCRLPPTTVYYVDCMVGTENPDVLLRCHDTPSASGCRRSLSAWPKSDINRRNFLPRSLFGLGNKTTKKKKKKCFSFFLNIYSGVYQEFLLAVPVTTWCGRFETCMYVTLRWSASLPVVAFTTSANFHKMVESVHILLSTQLHSGNVLLAAQKNVRFSVCSHLYIFFSWLFWAVRCIVGRRRGNQKGGNQSHYTSNNRRVVLR